MGSKPIEIRVEWDEKTGGAGSSAPVHAGRHGHLSTSPKTSYVSNSPPSGFLSSSPSAASVTVGFAPAGLSASSSSVDRTMVAHAGKEPGSGALALNNSQKKAKKNFRVVDLVEDFDDNLLNTFYNELMIKNFPLEDGKRHLVPVQSSERLTLSYDVKNWSPCLPGESVVCRKTRIPETALRTSTSCCFWMTTRMLLPTSLWK